MKPVLGEIILAQWLDHRDTHSNELLIGRHYKRKGNRDHV